MLYKILMYLFPDAKEKDWLLQDDGDGPYIKSRWPEEKQRNVLLGLLTQADVDACKSWVAAHITAYNQIEADIQASADPANLDVAGSARWPV